jgi:hypothetical protein
MLCSRSKRNTGPTGTASRFRQNPTFLTRYVDLIDHTYFDTQDLSTLAYIVLREFKSKSKTPTRDVAEFLIHEYATTYDADGARGLDSKLRTWLGYVYAKQCDEDFITSRLVRFARRQAIKLAIIKGIDLLDQEKPSRKDSGGPDAVDKVVTLITESGAVGASRGGGELLQDVIVDLPALWKGSAEFRNKVPSGITGFDEDSDGGPSGGELAVVMGPPNKGKSTLMSCIGARGAMYLKEQAEKSGEAPKWVIHISLEMSVRMLEMKYAAALSGMYIQDVKGGHIDYAAKARAEISRYAPVYLQYFIPMSTTAEEIKWFISNLCMCKGCTPGLLILDYADLLQGSEEDRFQGLGKIYYHLIQIGKTFSIPVWTGCQVRRDAAKDYTIDSTGVAESWKKVEAADIILTMNQTDHEHARGILRISSSKVRDGLALQTYYNKFDTQKVQLRSMTEEEIRDYQSSEDEANVTAPTRYRATQTKRRTSDPKPARPSSDPNLPQDFFSALSTPCAP